MSFSQAKFVGRKCIMRAGGGICRTSDELLESFLFAKVVGKYVRHLRERESRLLSVFGTVEVDGDGIGRLIKVFQALDRNSFEEVVSKNPDMKDLLQDPELLNDFVEHLYNYWRSFERFLVCDRGSEKNDPDKSPYQVFTDTIEQLDHLVRSVYRDIQRNIVGRGCKVYRQVCASAQVGVIVEPEDWPCPDGAYSVLRGVPMIRQMLLNPPLIIDPPMNKRTGQFTKVSTNPLEGLNIERDKWLCYPAKVGSLLIHVFFNESVIDLGCSLANLFELADEKDLLKAPDAVYVFGASEDDLSRYGSLPTVFFDDEENGLLVAAVPGGPQFGYFGYLKKMILTLHNAAMMKRGCMPYHGAMVNITLKNGCSATVLLIGDTGAGKSETLEAFRVLSEEHIRDMIIIADDMGSLEIRREGGLLGYGTEIGAFARLDDLPPSFAIEQIDRAIVMSAHKTNARVVLPVTSLANILKGWKVNFIFYANNHEDVGDGRPIIERFDSAEGALKVFSEGKVMAKGTTTDTGVVSKYWANIFGAPQYKELHDELAKKHMEAAFQDNVFVGQIRTRLGLAGWERKGPEETAKALLNIISKQEN